MDHQYNVKLNDDIFLYEECDRFEMSCEPGNDMSTSRGRRFTLDVSHLDTDPILLGHHPTFTSTFLIISPKHIHGDYCIVVVM